MFALCLIYKKEDDFVNFKNFKLQKLISPIDERDFGLEMISGAAEAKLPDNFSLTYQFDAKNQEK